MNSQPPNWNGLRRTAAGQARGTLLYLHGLGESSQCWAEVMQDDRLSPYNHVAVDLVGYGGLHRSGPPGTDDPGRRHPLTIPEHASQVQESIQQAGLHDVTVVGHSMGGVIGTLLCGLSSFIRAFVNVEGNLSAGDCTESAKAAQQSLEDFQACGFESLIASLEAKGKADPAFRGYSLHCRECDPRAFHLNARELVEMSGSARLIQQLRSVSRKMPTLFVAGFPRGLAPQSYDLIFENRIPLKMLYPSGHWPYIDRRDDFVEALLQFLKG